MAHTSDGGPAFPQSVSGHDGPTASYDFVDGGGMSLRDYFAAKALAGWIAANGIARIIETEKVSPASACDVLASSCYVLADSMLRARAAQSPAERQAAHLATFGGGK